MSLKGRAAAGAVIEVVGASHVGQVRARNEDVIASDAIRGWMVLADGMGGYQGGKVAANLAVDTIMSELERRYLPSWSEREATAALSGAICRANIEIHQTRRRNPDLALMGSTIVIAVFVKEGVVCGHVGDSRAYRMRSATETLDRLTRDHSVLQEAIDAGVISPEEAERVGARGPLTRGLGVAFDVTPSIACHAVDVGDVLLLCSDGLTDMLRDDEIRDVMRSQPVLDNAAQTLIDAANLRGGRDNVSLVMARMVV